MRRALAIILIGLLFSTFVLPARATPGVNDKRIKIGLHAPLTGAAPVPSDSMEKGKDLYFRWLAHRGVSVNGRDVKVILRNDQSDPSAAVSVCKELINQNRVFMLTGFAGPDEIMACARYAESVDALYVAPGTATVGLNDLERYFSSTTPWPRQARLLADFLVATKRARREKNGIVHFGTPTYNQAAARFVDGMEDRSARVHYQRQVSRAAGSSEAQALVEEMKENKIENVVVITSPVFFLQLLREAKAQNFRPLWTGIGVTMTFDTVAIVACRNNPRTRARFFSPFPAFADRDRFDRSFDRAVKLFHNGDGDDFMWQLWAHSRVLREMLDEAGNKLTRERFETRLERVAAIRTGITPVLRYGPSDHLGGRAIHVLRMDCAQQRWETSKTFVRDF